MLWFLILLIISGGVALYYHHKRTSKEKARTVEYTPQYSTPPSKPPDYVYTQPSTLAFTYMEPTVNNERPINTETTAPDDIEERNPDKDAWEGGFIGTAVNPFPAKATLEISYIDARGQASRRVVDVREFDTNPYCNLMIGHCRMRNATRTFRFDRIQQCTDVETGEVIIDVPAYLVSKYEASPEATLDRLFQNHYDILRILLYMGRADGRMTQKERSTILEYAKDLAGDDRIEDDLLKKAFQCIELPSPFAFKLCCGRTAKALSLDQYEKLITIAERMVSTEKRVSDMEQQALDYLRKRKPIF